ncbi:hypothetical protein FISHEDRAFT_62382 [Fistulina hepatica ATCC 64428]|nr:hypothetical protein FISHEDRAFT_62382 [Fistulina hepatica ATCC 64428]
MRFSSIVASGLVLTAANAMARPTFNDYDIKNALTRRDQLYAGRLRAREASIGMQNLIARDKKKKKGSQGSQGSSSGSGDKSSKSGSTSLDHKIATMPPEVRNKIGQATADTKHQEQVEAAAQKYHFAENSKHAKTAKHVNGEEQPPNRWTDYASDAYEVAEKNRRP